MALGRNLGGFFISLHKCIIHSMRKISNFHTHTMLCHHAKGTPRDYYIQAAREGCLALGFSDHCPFPSSFADTWPHIRMSVEDSRLYIKEIQQIKDESPFPIYAGYECEYDPAFDSWYDELKSAYGADYLVLGSHWVTDGSMHLYAPELDDLAAIGRYIDQTIDGMRSGHFSFLAHPDLFMMGYKRWDENSIAWCKALVDAAVDLGLPLEVNGLGTMREPHNTERGMRYPYPVVEFWEMVAQSSAGVVCNSDAHRPEDVIMNAWRSRDFSSRFGLDPLDSIFAMKQ